MFDVESESLDDKGVLNTDTTDKVGEDGEEHEDVDLGVLEGLDESVRIA